MALYGKNINHEKRKSSPTCEACGLAPDFRYQRHVDYGRGIGVYKHAQNRIRINSYYANHKNVNRPDLADKMLCPDCAEILVFIPVNK